MSSHAQLKLGKRPRRCDPRTLKMARYLTSTLAPAPSAVDYTKGITDWGVMLNDRLGCCTIAAAGHAVQALSANARQEVTVPDSAILEYYEKWDGYNPAAPESDQGGVELDVLNNWRQQGFNGHPLDAYVAIDLGRRELEAGRLPDVATAIWLFGGVYVGVELPISAQHQDIWDLPRHLGAEDESGSWGGHAIFLVAYDFRSSGPGVEAPGCGAEANSSSPVAPPLPKPPVNLAGYAPPDPGTLTCITWGKTKQMTWAWFEKYCSEAYALVSSDWLSASGVSPSGFDLATLEDDLKFVTA